MQQPQPFDRTFLTIVLILVAFGFLIFSSASLGLLARNGASFSSVAMSQFLFGIVGGGIALYIMSSIHYRVWRKYAFYIFLFTVLCTLLVFVPGLGFSHGGATRWIQLGSFTFQPAELLKIGFIIYLATWLSGMSQHAGNFVRGTLPFFSLLTILGFVLLLQPDTDTFSIIAAAGLAMYITGGARIRDIGIVCIVGILLLVALAFMRPYVMERIATFIDPSKDPQGAGYQITQSLIAVGSGGVWGRGFGQSVQKFEYLPEPIGDSIFAVYSEEFGFVGSVILILIFAFFTLRGYRIATHAPDPFGMYLVVGFVTLIATQAFLNISSMLGLTPLSGLPLPFISHGGSALFAALASVGIVLNVSKYRRRASK